jgi:predicted DNA-binding WGR domain protein
MHRFYALHVAPTLFGEWSLVTEWGRIGSAGKVMHRTFQTEGLAQTALARRLKIKTRRGYQLWTRETAYDQLFIVKRFERFG